MFLLSKQIGKFISSEKQDCLNLIISHFNALYYHIKQEPTKEDKVNILLRRSGFILLTTPPSDKDTTTDTTSTVTTTITAPAEEYHLLLFINLYSQRESSYVKHKKNYRNPKVYYSTITPDHNQQNSSTTMKMTTPPPAYCNSFPNDGQEFTFSFTNYDFDELVQSILVWKKKNELNQNIDDRLFLSSHCHVHVFLRERRKEYMYCGVAETISIHRDDDGGDDSIQCKESMIIEDTVDLLSLVDTVSLSEPNTSIIKKKNTRKDQRNNKSLITFQFLLSFFDPNTLIDFHSKYKDNEIETDFEEWNNNNNNNQRFIPLKENPEFRRLIQQHQSILEQQQQQESFTINTSPTLENRETTTNK
jgi:uncharacterized protein YbgA (DUF1722 family)